MVNTLQLKKQIERQKSINAGIKELKELSKEKQRLELEYRLLRGESKPKTTWTKVGSELKSIGSKIMDAAAKGRRELESKEKKEGSLFRW